jgi:hypothetical protein
LDLPLVYLQLEVLVREDLKIDVSRSHVVDASLTPSDPLRRIRISLVRDCVVMNRD